MTKETENHSFRKDTSWFVSEVNSRKRVLPVFAHAASMITERADKDLTKFIEAHSDEKEYDESGILTRYTVPEGLSGRHSFLKRAFDDFSIFAVTLPRMTLVSVVSLFDAYLSRILKNVYMVRPEILNSSNKQLTFSEIVKFGSIEDAKNSIIEKEIETLLRDSHISQFAWLEKNLDVKLTDLAAWKCFIELTERRNLLVHADGMVSAHYIETCRKHGIELAEGTNLGDQLDVSDEYYKKACNCVAEIGVKLSQVLWRKLIPKELEEAEDSFIEVTYGLLLSKEYELAEQLLEITKVKGFKKLNAESGLYMTVNLAICLKGQEKNDQCLKLLSSIDFSALSAKFKLANYVLREEYDAAEKVMRQIGDSEELTEVNYREWPLFRWFRKTDQFKSAFKDIFGDEYVIIEDRTPHESGTEPDDVSPEKHLPSSPNASKNHTEPPCATGEPDPESPLN